MWCYSHAEVRRHFPRLRGKELRLGGCCHRKLDDDNHFLDATSCSSKKHLRTESKDSGNLTIPLGNNAVIHHNWQGPTLSHGCPLWRFLGLRVSDLYARSGPIISFEFFPPKTVEAAERVMRTLG